MTSSRLERTLRVERPGLACMNLYQSKMLDLNAFDLVVGYSIRTGNGLKSSVADGTPASAIIIARLKLM